MDWIEFFEKYGVSYVEGPAKDVSTGAIGISCPMCGDDTGTHFAVVAGEPKVKGCWRDSGHFMTATQLVQHLAGCSVRRARRILFGEDVIPSVEELGQRLTQIGDQTTSRPHAPTAVVGDPSFAPFVGSPEEARYAEYLQSRGFSPRDLCDRYDVRWCPEGAFGDRVIVPIYMHESPHSRVLCGWTGRSVGRSPIRYKAYPPGDALSHCLLETGYVSPESHLVVVEGPFDALKVAEAGDYVAVALMTNRVGPGKLSRLLQLARRARRCSIMLDSDAFETQAFQLKTDMLGHGDLVMLPSGAKDPGDLSPQQIRSLL